MSGARSRSRPALQCEQTSTATSERVNGNLRPCGCARRYLPPHTSTPPPHRPGRSRSSTASSGKPRSRTPSNPPSSGPRTPPTIPGCTTRMGLKERAQSEGALLDLQEEPKLSQQRFASCKSSNQLKSKGMTAVYTTTVLIRIASTTRRHLIDEIKYEMKLTPQQRGNISSPQQKGNSSSTNTSKTKTNPETPTTTTKTGSRQTGNGQKRLFRTEFEVEFQRPTQNSTLIRIQRPTPINSSSSIPSSSSSKANKQRERQEKEEEEEKEEGVEEEEEEHEEEESHIDSQHHLVQENIPEQDNEDEEEEDEEEGGDKEQITLMNN